mmetsp:Transcript_22493/g.57882  ORF Transcript_22493/g.57882 Transcript_22493/m.57882 type:complete len:261 (-) Transcript_22493:52-834(-)
MGRSRREQQERVLRDSRTGSLLRARALRKGIKIPPSAERKRPAGSYRYHVFLCHVWSTGQDQCRVLKQELEGLVLDRDLRVFLHMDDLRSNTELERFVAASESIVLFVTDGFFESPSVMREVLEALRLGMPIFIVFDSGSQHGSVALPEQRLRCLAALRKHCPSWTPEQVEMVARRFFDTPESPPIGWFREREFLDATLLALCEQLRANGVLLPSASTAGPPDAPPHTLRIEPARRVWTGCARITFSPAAISIILERDET